MIRHALIIFTAAGVAGAAGPLDPPAGPVAPTGLTLAEIEPRTVIGPETTPGDADSVYRIAEPGSYYLVGDVIGVAGKRGIEIAANDVTIDLGGFAVVGAGGSLEGIGHTSLPAENIAVRDGVVRGWGREGIRLQGVRMCDIEGVRAIGCATFGIQTGDAARVHGCTAIGNGAGISTMNASVVSDCVASANAGPGIALGIAAAARGCVARDNAGVGISTSLGSIVTACSARDNAGAGFSLGSGTSMYACNSGSNSGTGVRAESACAIRGSLVTANFGEGIDVGSTCLVAGNEAKSHPLGSGIRARGAGNHIADNHVLLGSAGVTVAQSGNVVVRNTSRGNSAHFSIVPGNLDGQVLIRSGIISTHNSFANLGF